MIKSNLAILLAEKGIKISRMAVETGLSRTTLTALAQNEFQGIQMETLNTICNYFRTEPCKVLEYTPIDIDIVIEEPEQTEKALLILGDSRQEDFDDALVKELNFEVFLKIKRNGLKVEEIFQFTGIVVDMGGEIYNLTVFHAEPNNIATFVETVSEKIGRSFQGYIDNKVLSAINQRIQAIQCSSIAFQWERF